MSLSVLHFTPKQTDEIYARFQQLKTLRHPNLCRYVDLRGNEQGQLFLFSEYGSVIESFNIKKYTWQILCALLYLEEHGIRDVLLNTDNVVLVDGNVRLYNWGFYYLTKFGSLVDFPIGDPNFYSPSMLLCVAGKEHAVSEHQDKGSEKVYSECKQEEKEDNASKSLKNQEFNADQANMDDISNEKHDETTGRVDENVDLVASNNEESSINENNDDPSKEIGNVTKSSENILLPAKNDTWALGKILLQLLAPKVNGIEINYNLIAFFDTALEQDQELISFIIECSKGLPIRQLMCHSFLDTFSLPKLWSKRPITKQINNMDIQELYYYWTLNGRDVEKEINQSSYSIISHIPDEIIRPGTTPSSSNIKVSIYNPIPQLISLAGIENITKQSPPQFNDQWKYVFKFNRGRLKTAWENNRSLATSSFSKERSIQYQYSRIQKFKNHLRTFPHSYGQLKIDAVLDVPPYLRGEIWAAILNVRGDPRLRYEMFDNETPHDIDRQLEMDIARCHQYHPLLSSPQGQAKLKRVLKAWVNAETGKQVYWQGLDSLCAPFLALNFNNEARAFCSLQQFIRNFCAGFFVADNSLLMRKYVMVFRYLLSFHHPGLASHLYHIGLGPELFVISWFMTFFAHIFPLDRIFILWDHFLTGPPCLFLFVGISIVAQLHDQLISSDFSQAMLIFSDLPDISVELALGEAIQMTKITPPSLLENIGEMEGSISNNSPEIARRFSFLSSKTGIIGACSIEDYHEMSDFSLVIDTREETA